VVASFRTDDNTMARSGASNLHQFYILLKSTIFCKKNTKNSFFTTKSKNNGFLYFVKLFYIRVYMVFNKKTTFL
jgi:hypothetical protein